MAAELKRKAREAEEKAEDSKADEKAQDPKAEEKAATDCKDSIESEAKAEARLFFFLVVSSSL